ncbi:hypothetical protein CVN56_26385 [Rhodococcus sp. AQ5-07]|nr:hypothetical protein CVN56_26385 [Rhodococcus sp. AQ5-07]
MLRPGPYPTRRHRSAREWATTLTGSRRRRSGPADRTRAVAVAIRTGVEQNAGSDVIDERIAAAEAAGRPLSLWYRRCHSILTIHTFTRYIFRCSA